jgi:hypothetical protein
MKARHGITPIPMPAIQRSPAGIGRLSIEVRKSLAALRDRKIIVSNTSKTLTKSKPFDVKLQQSGESYTATVSPGFVLERIVPSGGDAVIYHLPDGIFAKDDEGADTEELEKHAIAPGQAIYIKVHTLVSGAIGIKPEEPPLPEPPPPVLVVVSGDNEESTHHEVPFGEGEGEPGFYYYKLAVMEGTKLKKNGGVAGQHIDHWADLPLFETEGGEKIEKEYDGGAGIYRLRGIEGIRQIEVTGAEDTIQVGGNNKDAKFVFKESGSSEGAEGEEINFNDGLNTDGEAPGEEPPDPKNIILPIVQGVSPIVVERSGAGNRTFTVSLDESESGDNFNVELLSVNLTCDGEDVTVSADSGPRMWYVRNGKIKLTDDMAAGLAVYQLISRIAAEGPTESGPGYTEPD